MSLKCCHEIQSLSYTPFYCEENIWKLCETIKTHEIDQLKNCYVIFISNFNETVAIWNQKTGKFDEDYLVVWDYHVILVYAPPNQQAYVYDFDTIHEFPSQFEKYCKNSFREALVNVQYHCKFRLISAESFLQTFASDRSRMKDKDGNFLKPPPNYDCIQTSSEINNLNKFISMDEEISFGNVMQLTELLQKFALNSQ